MNALDKIQLSLIVKDYPIIEVLDALQEAINNQVDELVDLEMGHSDMVKEMSLVAHHLEIFPRK
jgi:hypothetical protein